MRPSNATKLLISVRDAAEAAVVLEAGVDWIDLKEPHAGSLGRPSLKVAQDVAKILRTHPQRSAALGELGDLDSCGFESGPDFESSPGLQSSSGLQSSPDLQSGPVLQSSPAASFARLFPVLKVGLSGCKASKPDWQTRFKSLALALRNRGAELIPVAYADAATCSAPDLADVLQVAQQLTSSHLLIDTFTKDGSSLLDWLPLETLRTTIASARQFQCGIVLAGSLRLDDARQLLPLNPAALAIRGAVCQSSQIAGRTSPIDPTKVATWRALVR